MKEFINVNIKGVLGYVMILWFSIEIIKNIFNFAIWLSYIIGG